MASLDSHIEMSDFIAQYPSIDDPQIQTKIASKWEFAKLGSYPRDFHRNATGFYNHQDLVERLMRIYNRMILIHQTGSGKSYTIGALGEAARDMNDVYNGRNIRGVIVIVKGKTQLIDIKMTLVCKSTKGRYITPSVMSGTERGSRSSASRALRKWYDIRTYGAFAKELSSYSDDEVAEKYADYLIIMDEFHNIRLIDSMVMDREDRELKPSEDITKQMWRLSHYAKRCSVVGLSASIVINDVKEAISTLNIILPEDRQIPTDTDMNSITLDELGVYLNGYVSFVRSPDTQVYKRYIGQVFESDRESSDGSEYHSQLKLKVNVMSDMQSASYRIAYLTENFLDGGRKKSFMIASRQASKGIFPDGSWGNKGFNKYIKPDGKGWYKAEPELVKYYKEGNLRRLSVSADEVIKICRESKGITIIFDEHVDGSGLNYIAVAMDNLGFDRFDASKSMFTSKGKNAPALYCSGIDTSNRIPRANLKPTSVTGKIRYTMITKDTPNSHLTNILEAMSSPENSKGDYVKVIMISGKGKEGISIDNMATFVQYSGVWTPTAEHQAESRGFRAVSHVTPLKSLIQHNIINGMSKEYLEIARDKGADEETLRILANPGIPSDLASMWTYVIVDIYKFASFPNYDYRQTLKLRQEDVDRIRVQGINAMEEIILSNRGLSEGDISQLKKPMGDKANDLAKYLYSDEINTNGFYVNNDKIESIDYSMYLYTESKNVDFKRLLNKMKRLAIDCHIHHKRNIWPDDKDNSPESDYGPKDWQCHSPPPTYMDFTTSDVYYLEDALSEIRSSIELYFRNNGSGDVYMIQYALNPDGKNPYFSRIKYIEITLARMIINRETIIDRFGYSVYLQENKGVYYTTRDFPLSDVVNYDQTSSFYGSTFIVNNPMQMDSFIVTKEKSIFDTTFSNLRTINQNSDRYIDELKDATVKMPIETQAMLLEHCLVEYAKGVKDKLIESLIESFGPVIFWTHEPKERFKRMNKIRRAKKKYDSEGNPIVDRVNFVTDGVDWEEETGNDIIYIHTLYTHRKGMASYNDISSIIGVSGRLRILNMKEGKGWREPNEYEFESYNYFVQLAIYNKIVETDTKFPYIYGIDIKDGILHIRSVISEKVKIAGGKKLTLRDLNRGRECKTFKTNTLIDFYWFIGGHYSSDNQFTEVSRADKIYKIKQMMDTGVSEDGTRVESWDDKRLLFYYTWARSGSKKEHLCKYITDKLKSMGAILYLR